MKQDDFRQARQRWEQTTLKETLDRFHERAEEFITISSEPIERLYTPLDADGDYMEQLGFPGEYPFTRGVHPTMHRGRLWTMRMFAGFGAAEETNARFKYLLEQGQTGLSTAFDLPTLMGYDSDAPEAIGEFGKCGVAVSSLKDMEILLEGIPLEKVSSSMTINSPAAIIWAMYIAAAEKQGLRPEQLRGTTQNDILKEYIAQKEYILPPEPSMRLVVDTIEYGTNSVPQWNTISISGYHIREAGATAVQELAFTLADGFHYIESCIERGMDVDAFAPRLSFFFNAHSDFFEEVAKYRAARRIYAKRMRHKYGATKERSWMLRFHTQTAGSTLTAQQPENNIVRVALQALAAVLGGTQSLHTNSMDEALWLPTEKAVRVALRTQQMIAHESGVADTVDPLAGAYMLEYLTDEIERRAEAYIRKIDQQGGALAAIEGGYMQGEIQNAAYEYQRGVEEGREIVVGVNAFRTDLPANLKRVEVNPVVEDAQRQRLEQVRRRRDPKRIADLLTQLSQAAEGNENMISLFIECVEADMTLGEICRRLREVWGEYQPPLIF